MEPKTSNLCLPTQQSKGSLRIFHQQFGYFSDLGLAGTLTASAPLVSRGLANRQQTPIRAGRGRGAAGSRAASARLYGARRKSSSPAEVSYTERQNL